jgi:hypothetical protein
VNVGANVFIKFFTLIFSPRFRVENFYVFSPDGKQLASIENENVRVWDLTTGKTLQILMGYSGAVIAIASSPDGEQPVSISWGLFVRVCNLAIEVTLKFLKGLSDYVSVVILSPNGKQLASGSSDATVRVWDVAMGKSLQIF